MAKTHLITFACYIFFDDSPIQMSFTILHSTEGDTLTLQDFIDAERKAISLVPKEHIESYRVELLPVFVYTLDRAYSEEELYTYTESYY